MWHKAAEVEEVVIDYVLPAEHLICLHPHIYIHIIHGCNLANCSLLHRVEERACRLLCFFALFYRNVNFTACKQQHDAQTRVLGGIHTTFPILHSHSNTAVRCKDYYYHHERKTNNTPSYRLERHLLPVLIRMSE